MKTLSANEFEEGYSMLDAVVFLVVASVLLSGMYFLLKRVLSFSSGIIGLSERIISEAKNVP